MHLPDSAAKRFLGRKLPWFRSDQRTTAAYVASAGFRTHYVVTRRQVARYVSTRRTVLFGPGAPLAHRHSTIVKALVRLGIRATGVPERRGPEAVMAWLDATVVSPDHVTELVRTYGRVINAQCVDIGKDAVEETHRAAFGYGMAVDPRQGGTYVRKSVDNATHDALVFEGPSEPEPGYVYQRLIHNRFRDGLYEEMRVPYIGSCLPVCILKLKVPARRFRGMPDLDEIRELDRGDFHAFANAVPLELMITKEEMASIDRFAQKIGLDYGEFDVLRDTDNGRLYVIDANKTPGGPTIAFGPRDMRRYLDAYTDAVESMLTHYALR